MNNFIYRLDKEKKTSDKIEISSPNIRLAVEKMFAEAEKVAKGEGEYYTLSDLTEDA